MAAKKTENPNAVHPIGVTLNIFSEKQLAYNILLNRSATPKELDLILYQNVEAIREIIGPRRLVFFMADPITKKATQPMNLDKSLLEHGINEGDTIVVCPGHARN